MTYRIGLLSDTHMPARWNEIHSTLPAIFEGVDLILHAGDVGELWVLDKLSAIAPIVAVHGNDETAEATEHLPLTQIVTIGGVRILIWHGHFVDRVDENGGSTTASDAAKTGAHFPIRPSCWRHISSISVIGTSHSNATSKGFGWLTLGGIASGNFACRQLIQTVAVLELGADSFNIKHFNLKDGSPYHPADVVEEDFETAMTPYVGTILDDVLEEKRPHIWSNPILHETLMALAPRCWWGEQDVLITADFENALKERAKSNLEVKSAFDLLIS